MGLIIALIIAALGFAVWKGKLRAQQLPPILLGIGGAFLAARGNLLIGVIAIGVAITWYRGLTWRLFGTRAKQSDQYAVDKARFMLGVSRFDNETGIRERHAALIAKNHPDTGGSEERAKELNAARDLLLRDLRDKAS
jgi:uncharacterized SAM-binding protein YcdF (DUF218 family)